jgi:cyclase
MRILRTFSLMVFAATAVAASAQTPETLPFTLKALGHGVYAAIDDAKGDAGANAGFVIGDDGVLVVDTFENEKAARALLGEIRKLTALPIKFVVNTHYHLDHVAGNVVFKGAGAVIVAHAYVADWIHTQNEKFFGDNIKPEHVKMLRDLVGPDVLYTHDLTLSLGKRRVVIGHQLGHTGGDTIVAIPDAHVYFFGDLFWRKTLPNLIDATVADWLGLGSALPANRVDKVTDIFVPGHGDVGDVTDVKEFIGYLSDLEQWVRASLNQGKDGDGIIAAVMPQLKEKYGMWQFFDYFAKSNIKDIAAELKATKRVPVVDPPKS